MNHTIQQQLQKLIDELIEDMELAKRQAETSTSPDWWKGYASACNTIRKRLEALG